MTVTEIKYKSNFIHIAVTQVLCIALLILALIITKWLSPSVFSGARSWCVENLFDETNVSQMFEEDTTDEI